MNLHDKHKVLPINDEQALKKENISIDNSIKDFLENVKKLQDLKIKIEEEMLGLDKLYVKTNEEITKFFKLKIEKLVLEENDLKEKLKNEITKIKEKMELFLSNVKELTSSCEKIQKGIKLIENNEKNMMIILSYVSKINKNKKEMKKIFNELVKNIKIDFNKEEKKIEFTEYYFNGISIPKDIQFNNISSNSFQISWKYDEDNLDNKLIKFRVELRKEDSNEKFIQVYEGSENNSQINNLKLNTKYEIRICSLYNNIKSIWSEIQKIKTIDINLNIESIILNETGKKDIFLEKIYNWVECKNLELLYRGTRDGMHAVNFHQKCDNQGPTITLFKNDKGNVFGGYSSISWASKGSYVSDKNTFLFTLTNIYGTEPTKFKSKKEDNKVFHQDDRGPTFGADQDIWIPPDFIGSKSEVINFPKSYEDVLQKGNTIFTGDLNNNKGIFKLKELEVFKLS